jgi:predicted nucleic acid-binding protein
VTTGDSASVLLDASALIALLGGEPAASDVQTILRDGAAAMTTLNLAESVDRLERRYGIASARARPVIEGLLDDALTLVPLGPAEAWRAAEIRAGHYHRTRCPISLADAVLIASAEASRTVASADRHVLAVAASEGIATTQLPDSRGRRPRV